MPRALFLRLSLPYLILLLAASLLFLRHGGAPAVDSSARSLIASDARTLETFDKVASLLPEDVLVLVILQHPDLFSDSGAALIAEVSDRMLALPGCQEVKSLTHSGRPVRRGLGLDIESFIPLRATPAEWTRLREFATRFPLSRNVLVSDDARHTVLLGMFQRELPDPASRDAFRREFLAALDGVAPRVEALHILSFPFVEAEALAATHADLTRYLLLASLLIPLILFAAFRSPGLMLHVLLVEACGLLWVAAVFPLCEQPVDLHTSILFPLGAGVQLTFVIHQAAALRRFLRTHPPREAAALALRETLAPAALAALTTLAGLLTLAFSDLPRIAAFGRLGMLAVSGLFLLSFLPPALASLGVRVTPNPADLPSSTPIFPLRHRHLLLALFAAASLLFALQLPRLRGDVRAMEFLPKGHALRDTLSLLDSDLGGINLFQLEIEGGAPRAMQTEPVLRYLEDLRRFARSLPGVTDAYAYSQLYIALNQIWEGDESAEGSLPASPLRLTFFSGILNNSPLLFRDAFVSPDASSSLFLLRSRDMPAADYLALLQRFMTEAERLKPPGVSLHPVHGLHSVLEGEQQLLRNQTRSLAGGFLLIGLLLALLWRSARPAAAVLLANLPAILALFGLMALTGVALNSVTIMVAAVLIGIAVDDGIHLVAAVRTARREGLPPAAAIAAAWRAKLLPIACTSAILLVFFGLLALSRFPPVAHFGLLAAWGLLTALAGAALLLPALLNCGFLLPPSQGCPSHPQDATNP